MPSTASQTILLPGDIVLTGDLPRPTSKSGILKLGPGLSHVPPSTISATVAGPLRTDTKKNTVWIENHTGRYIPQPNDAVLATVHHSATDLFYVSITPHAPLATLPHLAFEHATKKTRPQLGSGALVYARVVSSPIHNKFQEPELTCVHPQTGKADGMGELKGGMVFAISRGMAARLLAKKQREEGGVVVLEVLGGKWPFEVAVGRNGFLWVDAAGDVLRTLVVGRAITETDKGKLGEKEQERVVKRLCRELGTET